MDIEKISALLRALELGSLSAAAEALGYTPSGMSRMMASLETEAGFPLLIRSREGLRPTREGERLLPYFHALAEDASRMLPLEPPRNISIGIATPHREVLSPAAIKFLEMAQAYFPA